MVDEWCPGCGEFGHTVAICPTQYQGEEWGLEVGEVGHVSPDYNHSPPQEEEVGLEPQPQEEDGWEALLRSMGVQYRLSNEMLRILSKIPAEGVCSTLSSVAEILQQEEATSDLEYKAASAEKAYIEPTSVQDYSSRGRWPIRNCGLTHPG
ncbi:UNVERIFIED_CONTAM: hypothetical protein FKN15_002081 [Acipenser sinensis]